MPDARPIRSAMIAPGSGPGAGGLAETDRLRDGFARLADEVEFDHLLLAHGTPVIGDARERLRRFAAGS